MAPLSTSSAALMAVNRAEQKLGLTSGRRLLEVSDKKRKKLAGKTLRIGAAEECRFAHSSGRQVKVQSPGIWGHALIFLSLLILFLTIIPVSSALTLENVDGIWSNAKSSSAGVDPSCLRYDNTPDTTDENKVAYGTDADCPAQLDFDHQSGFGFDGRGSVDINPGDMVKLGTFRHHNHDIFANDILNQVDLEIKLDFPGSSDPTLVYTLHLDETPNEGTCQSCTYSPCSTPCPDKVWWTTTTSTTVFTIDNKMYTLEILGFGDCDDPNSISNGFVTQEDLDN